MQALSNGIICKRNNPTTYEGSRIEIPDKFRKTKHLNRWVTVVSVGEKCREDVKVGDRLYIGDNMGRPFNYEDEEFVFVIDAEIPLRERDE